MHAYDLKMGVAFLTVFLAGWLLVAFAQFPRALSPAVPIMSGEPAEGFATVATSTDHVSSGAAKPETTVMAWIYPGKTSCSVSAEYTDGRKIDVLKPEYYTVTTTGRLLLLTEKARGCQGYSAANVANIRANSTEQYVTVSGLLDGIRALTGTASLRKQAVTTLVNFTNDTGFTGVEIDFEDYGSWDAKTYANYKTFLKELGNALHATGKKLMVDLPPIGSELEQSYYVLTYEDMNALPIDYLVIMAYDYQFDYGVGSPIAPNEWVRAIILHAKQTIPDTNRIVIGIPAYAYSGATGSYSIIRKTTNDFKSLKGFLTARVDEESHERIFTIGRTSYVYVDSAGLDAKRALVEAEGITNISIWSLGGNAWFSN